MSNQPTPDQLEQFVEMAPFLEGSIDENLIQQFGISESDLEFKQLTLLSKHIFDCECCNNIFSTEFAVLYEEEQNWCKWCFAEDEIEKDFAEGNINFETYEAKMKELSREE